MQSPPHLQNHWDERANFKQAYDRYYYIPSTYDEEDEAKVRLLHLHA